MKFFGDEKVFIHQSSRASAWEDDDVCAARWPKQLLFSVRNERVRERERDMRARKNAHFFRRYFLQCEPQKDVQFILFMNLI